MKNRVGRIIVAILALAAFGFYAYRYEQTHWHSADVEAWGPATGLHPEAFDPGIALYEETINEINAAISDPATALHPEGSEGNDDPNAPIVMNYGTGSGEQPTQEAATAEQPVVETVPTEQPLRFDLSEWQYMLVNGDHSIDQYEPENLVYLNMTADETDFQTSFNPNRIAVDARIAQPLMDMALACKAAGLPVYLSSGYRSYADQAANFTRVCQNNGITDGKDSNGHYITMPAGCSEHQTGLCCDITDYYQATKNSSLDDIPTLVWLRENCADYGFIWRFPSDKSDVTGVMGESWHFRYVGQDAAHYIMDNHLTLEEFWQQFGDSASV